MRRLTRRDLPEKVGRYLAYCSGKTAEAVDPKKAAGRLWENKRKSAFSVIRDTLCQMASGVERCMYCEDNEGTDIEHFRPKSVYPEHTFDWHNYLLACSACNSNHKRTRFPLDGGGEPLLIDPTAEDPRAHLRFSPKTGKYRAQTDKGHHSIDVFGLDRSNLETSRRNAWDQIQALIVHYALMVRDGNKTRAARLQQTIRQIPHSAVLVEILQEAGNPRADIDQRCLDALDAHPEIQEWLV